MDVVADPATIFERRHALHAALIAALEAETAAAARVAAGEAHYAAIARIVAAFAGVTGTPKSGDAVAGAARLRTDIEARRARIDSRGRRRALCDGSSVNKPRGPKRWSRRRAHSAFGRAGCGARG